jgi:hypothetical protein
MASPDPPSGSRPASARGSGRLDPTPIINDLRRRVDRWRALGPTHT